MWVSPQLVLEGSSNFIKLLYNFFAVTNVLIDVTIKVSKLVVQITHDCAYNVDFKNID